jgi:hypothetical protein
MNPSQTGSIVFSWAGNRAGREAKGLEVFARAGVYYEGLEKAGTISGTKVYLPVTGSGLSLYIVEGKVKDLLELITDDEFMRLAQEAGLVTEGFAMNVYIGGSQDSLSEGVGNYVTLLSDHGLV